MLSSEQDSCIIEYRIALDKKYPFLISIFSLMSEYVYLFIFYLLKREIMFLDDLISHEIMLASVEQIEFRLLVIFKSLVPIEMVRINIEQDAYVVSFL